MNIIDITEQALVDYWGVPDPSDRESASAIIGAIAIPFREMIRSELQSMTDDEIIDWVRAK